MQTMEKADEVNEMQAGKGIRQRAEHTNGTQCGAQVEEVRALGCCRVGRRACTALCEPGLRKATCIQHLC
jgi:hypothetical protein